MLIEHRGELEKFQWFVRAHLESAGGTLAHEGTRTEKSAASAAKRKSTRSKQRSAHLADAVRG